MVKSRTQTVNRLHVLLTQLLPAGASRNLERRRRRATAAHRPPAQHRVRAPCGGWPPSSSGRSATSTGASRRLPAQISAAVTATGSTLTELRGVGDLTAGKILARVGDITRFRSSAAFASYTGTAPIEVSSGDVVRHRLSRAGDRQLNYCLHIMAITQIQRDYPRARLLPAQTRRWEGPQRSDAMPEAKAVGPGLPPPHARRPCARRRRAREDTRGRLQSPARPAQPRPPALRKSHFPDPPGLTLQPPIQDLLDTERSR